VHILIVEDDEDVRRSIRGWLLGKRHTATWCKSGREALEALHREHFDLVILDMILEGLMTGWDVAYIKHVDPELSGIPLVIMTGMSTADVHAGAHVQEAATRAALLIIPKPLDFLALERVLLAIDEPVTKVHGRKTLEPERKDGS
jgi:DNA-binding NtrC family response regulator